VGRETRCPWPPTLENAPRRRVHSRLPAAGGAGDRMSSTVFPHASSPAARRAGGPRSRATGRLRPAVGALAALLAAGGAAVPATAAAEHRIRVQTSRGVVELALEEYVAGVVSAEMPASFPPEALKAQAVAARSYALTRKMDARVAGRAFDIGSGVLAQVWTERPSAAGLAAASATAGEVLVLGVDPVEAYFHSTCGGRTEAGLAALGRDLPYLVAVDCGRCEKAPRARWRLEVPAAELGRIAGFGGAAATRARVVSRTASGRAERVSIEAGRRNVTLTATDLRQRLGWSRLPSVAFDVRAENGAFAFEGRGHGHGSGLCQWGAAGLAREGQGYREILGRYYPGTEIVRMY
jgi:stage II sporulation protein D